MLEDRILETYIHDLPAPPLSLIESYLRDTGFLHVACMGRGVNWTPSLVSTLVERWRLDTHTFHLICGECTITLKDMQLQIGLPVDGLVVIGSVVVAVWRDVCEQLLGKVSDTIYGAEIDMNWLKRNFGGLNAKLSEVERKQHAWAYILMIIGLGVSHVGDVVSGDVGVVPVVFFTSSSGLPLYILTLTRWNDRLSYVGLPEKLQDIRLLLDQRLEAEFEWTSYSDSRIQKCISSKFLVNLNI
ncbi:hypothetical protein CXB51_026494 [Gossypium anomalum]|uniref:Aminotransferase-like plant mobile domain-containing protein n=1 Tax=Gossypium anomalum TaxID=47600 RepID=A0A8J5YM65_9ROSI|nr:hypothetical protein CXB51_026494 [Gossypium anomalum]